MSNVDVTLESSQANQEWQAYFGEVDRLLRPLAADRRTEVRDELVSHVLDGMDAESDGNEETRLRRVLDRLGPPAEYLERAVGELVTEGEHSTSWRLRRGIATLGRNAALVSTYLIGFFAIAIAIAKPFFPEYVGLHRLQSGWYMAGYVDVGESTELLGYWIIPLMLVLCWFFWIVIPRWIRRMAD